MGHLIVRPASHLPPNPPGCHMRRHALGHHGIWLIGHLLGGHGFQHWFHKPEGFLFCSYRDAPLSAKGQPSLQDL